MIIIDYYFYFTYNVVTKELKMFPQTYDVEYIYLDKMGVTPLPGKLGKLSVYNSKNLNEFFRKLNPSLNVSLKISGNFKNNVGFINFLSQITPPKLLKHLSIDNIGIKDSLFNFLIDVKSIKSLQLNNCHIVGDGRQLLTSLEKNKTLKHLSIKNNGAKEGLYDGIIDILFKKNQYKSLNIQGNLISLTSLNKIQAILCKNNGLQKLFFSVNDQMNHNDWSLIVSKGIEGNSTLLQLGINKYNSEKTLTPLSQIEVIILNKALRKNITLQLVDFGQDLLPSPKEEFNHYDLFEKVFIPRNISCIASLTPQEGHHSKQMIKVYIGCSLINIGENILNSLSNFEKQHVKKISIIHGNFNTYKSN